MTHTTTPWRQRLMHGLLWATLALAGNPMAQAAANKESSVAHAPPRPQRAGPLRVKPSPSHETRAERERRLKRECRGRPNGGACLGFAS